MWSVAWLFAFFLMCSNHTLFDFEPAESNTCRTSSSAGNTNDPSPSGARAGECEASRRMWGPETNSVLEIHNLVSGWVSSQLRIITDYYYQTNSRGKEYWYFLVSTNYIGIFFNVINAQISNVFFSVLVNNSQVSKLSSCCSSGFNRTFAHVQRSVIIVLPGVCVHFL